MVQLSKGLLETVDPECLQRIIGLIHMRHQAQQGTDILTALRPSSLTSGSQSLNLKMGVISCNMLKT